jgi:hypothetical protein
MRHMCIRISKAQLGCCVYHVLMKSVKSDYLAATNAAIPRGFRIGPLVVHICVTFTGASHLIHLCRFSFGSGTLLSQCRIWGWFGEQHSGTTIQGTFRKFKILRRMFHVGMLVRSWIPTRIMYNAFVLNNII